MSEHCARNCAQPNVSRALEAIDRLRRTSRKLTGPRHQILQTLQHQHHPVTIRELARLLPRGSCDTATIYRSIHLLEEMGLVKRYDFGDGSARFELLREGHGHHHHLVCTRCSSVVELEECFPPELEEAIARKNNFRAVTHRLEFFGICPDCQ